MKVLVIGSGGREHALCYKIAQSSLVDKIFCAPGNGGTAEVAENINISSSDVTGLLVFAKQKKVDLTVVGPEVPLVSGIVDRFNSAGLKIIGPTEECAMLEGSKIFAKNLMKKYKIPTAKYESFDNFESAFVYLKKVEYPCVIKADGLAAGKGVSIVHSIEEGRFILERLMKEEVFGASGKRVVIENFILGREVSLLVFTDGTNIAPMPLIEDHKQLYDMDLGPNTGGMGAWGPVDFVDEKKFQKIITDIVVPTIHAIKQEKSAFKGILYFGLITNETGTWVLEYNVRFGDPETQPLMLLLKTDIIEIFLKLLENRLDEIDIEWENKIAMCVSLVSKGYPGKYEKGLPIEGLDKIKDKEDIVVFHAGTTLDKENKIITNGGRVLSITGIGNTKEEVYNKVYDAIKDIKFDGMHYRKDIGRRGDGYKNA